ncbi:MAG: arylesterase [Pseudomonadota bacterium]
MVVFGYGALGALRKLSLALIFINLVSAAHAEDITIAALGDSLTQGYGLVPDQGLVPQLTRWLEDHGVEDVQILNAGVSGDTTAGGLSRVGWTLTPDVDAMIVTLGGNDVLRGIEPSVSKANLAGILDAAESANVDVLLIGMTAPGNYGPAYKDAFDAMYGELAAQYEALYMPDFFGGITGAGAGAGGEITPALAADFLQADGIHPNSAGVRNIVATIGPEVVKLIEQVRD